MKAEENVRRVRRWLEAFNRHDWHAGLELYAQDATMEDPTMPAYATGPGAIIQAFRDLGRCIPDFHAEVKTIVASDNMVVVEYTGSGAVARPLSGMPSSVVGRSINIPMVDVYQFGDGKVVRQTGYYDTGLMMRQLGLMPDD